MPTWKTSGRVFAAWSRRHGLNAPAQEILTGIIPVAEVDRHYTDDRLNVWGLFGQQLGTTGLLLGAVSLVAQERELLVHRVAYFFSGAPQILLTCHVFSPLQAYDPHSVGPALVLPWLQPVEPGSPGRLSRAFGLQGETALLQVVTVNGAPHTSIGPASQMFTLSSDLIDLWGYQDPPFRVRPFGQLTVQTTVLLPIGFGLNVSFWYSERDDQGAVG